MRRLGRPLAFVRQALHNFYVDGCFDRSAVVAYYALLSLAPSLYLFSLVIGGVLRRTDPAGTAIEGASAFIPTTLVPLIEEIRAGVVLDRALVMLALPGLLWMASSAFLSLEFGVNVAFRTVRRRRFWLARVKAFAGAFLAASVLVISSAVSNLLAWAERAQRHFGISIPSGPARRIVLLAPLAFASLALLYKILPRGPVRWRAAAIAAAGTVGLWDIARSVFGMFLQGSSYYGLLTGTLAGVVAFMVWVYTAVAVLLLGAELAALLNGNRRLPGGATELRSA